MCMQDYHMACRQYRGTSQDGVADGAAVLTFAPNIDRVCFLIGKPLAFGGDDVLVSFYRNLDDLGFSIPFITVFNQQEQFINIYQVGQLIQQQVHVRAISTGGSQSYNITEILMNKSPGPDGLIFSY